jgi:diguanylate cyclase (GGDEF)-like protein
VRRRAPSIEVSPGEGGVSGASSPVPPRADGAEADADAWATWQRERLAGVESGLAGDGLLDRRTLLDQLNRAIREAIASGAPAAAMLLDLNKFADVNGDWGPSIGDEVLLAAGVRIRDFIGARIAPSASGPAPMVGRLDADHFVVIAPSVASFEALRLAGAHLLRELAQPFPVAGRSIQVTARAAIVQIPAHGQSVTGVLGRGFRVLNSAARASGDGIVLSDEDAAAEASAIVLERDLAAALQDDQLSIALQPKVEVASGAVSGAEALARWQHPDLGPVAPQAFVQAAEKSGLIFELGLRILRETCRVSNKLAARGRGIDIAVNVSPRQLERPDFLSRFLEVVDKEGVAPETLAIEVTETAAMTGGERIVESLKSLRHCGIGIAIDDFGTGFSNLASLAALPADTLKIDRSLVTGLDRGGKAGALLDIAVQLGRNLGMRTVVEGVETTEQFQHVTALGCDFVQGYFTGRPVKASEFGDYYLRR